MPNLVETVVIQQACTRLGIIHHIVPIFFGVEELAQRIKTLKASIVFTVSEGFDKHIVV